MTRRPGFIAAAFALLAGPAAANPEGAPWGSADGAAACASCHFDGNAIDPSPMISLDGAPAAVSPGAVYDLILSFDKADAPVAGFLAAAFSGDETRRRVSCGRRRVGGDARRRNSLSTAPFVGGGAAIWRFRWRAPVTSTDPIRLHIAANAGNDDRSPFGDAVHFRTFEYSGK